MSIVENAKITKVSLSMANYGCLTLEIVLEGKDWGCNFGGYCLGHGYLGATIFKGSARGMEAIMKIMDTIGVECLEDAVGKYVRVKKEGRGSRLHCIGNIIEDKWFDYDEFFSMEEDKEE